MWVYLNDGFLPENEAKVSVFDYGFLYGDGLFETLRAYNGRIFALEAHLARLSRSALALRLPLPPKPQLQTLLYETLQKNGLKDTLLRLSLSRGRGEAGLQPMHCGKPTLVITARPFEGYTADQYKNGISAIISKVRRSSPTGSGPSPKSLSFLNNVLAKLEAAEQGAFEGILLNEAGFLTEGSVSNLFWISEGKLRTPSSAAGILEGVTREIIIALAKENGWLVEEGLFRAEALLVAEEAFLSNTGLELMPLTLLDGKKIGTGQQGSNTDKLHELYRKHVIEKV